MHSQQYTLQLLGAYQPTDDKEQQAKQFIHDFVQQTPAYWARSTLTGHLTASAWITNPEQSKAILLHHKKLDLWVQPGGHIDDDDTSLAMASKREASEETGLVDLELKQMGIFDLDVHLIPARQSEPEHWHLDIRYWFVAMGEQRLSINSESNDLAWLSKPEIEQKTNEESVLRMARKTLIRN